MSSTKDEDVCNAAAKGGQQEAGGQQGEGGGADQAGTHGNDGTGR